MRKYIIISLLILLWPFSQLRAAELIISNTYQQVNVDQTFEVKVYLNTENEEINAISGKVFFPENNLGLVRVKNNNSIVSFWIEPPASRNNGEVNFSGIIPGGLLDNRSEVFSLVFQSKLPGQGQIGGEEFSALLNDGLGTAAVAKIVPADFDISTESQVYQLTVEDIPDLDAPEVFNPLLTQIAEIAQDKYLLVFLTQDKGSGIDHYEVKEGFGNYNIAVSPYILKNQKLNQKILVKAVDQSGNERVVTFIPPNYQPWYQNYQLFAIIILAIVVVYLTQRQYFKKNKKRNKK